MKIVSVVVVHLIHIPDIPHDLDLWPFSLETDLYVTWVTRALLPRILLL